MHDPLDAATILFALLAIFVLWKLRSVLGTRNNNEKQPPANAFFRRSTRTNDNNDNKVIPLPSGAEPPRASLAPPQPSSSEPRGEYVEAGSKAALGLDAIAAADRSFVIQTFIAGAKTAYEMIVAAFAAGDRDTLQKLLARDVYESFIAAIAGRESRGETMKSAVIGIDKVSVDDASLRDRTAQITLRFASKLVTVTRSAAGTIIEGNPERVLDIVDIWTFARAVDSRDPNWKLIATQTGH